MSYKARYHVIKPVEPDGTAYDYNEWSVRLIMNLPGDELPEFSVIVEHENGPKWLYYTDGSKLYYRQPNGGMDKRLYDILMHKISKQIDEGVSSSPVTFS